MDARWPCEGRARAAHHRRAELSLEAVTTIDESELMTTLVTSSSWP